jgi:hypothetical protein
MLHEIAHFLGVEGNRKGEETQGLLQAEFYTMLANNFRGTKWERVYRALARQGRDYAGRFSLKSLLLGKLPSSSDNGQLEKLVDKFAAEADVLELEGEEAKEYASSRLEETYGSLLKDGNSAKISRKTNNKNLESRVKEEKSEKAEAKEAPSEAKGE